MDSKGFATLLLALELDLREIARNQEGEARLNGSIVCLVDSKVVF